MLRNESEIIENAVMFALIGMETGISISWAHRNEQIYLYSTFLAIFITRVTIVNGLTFVLWDTKVAFMFSWLQLKTQKKEDQNKKGEKKAKQKRTKWKKKPIVIFSQRKSPLYNIAIESDRAEWAHSIVSMQ